MFATSDLGPLLAERGIELSREQTYRLVVGTPERLNLHVLAALCDILECTPAELIEPVVETRQSRKTATGGTGATGLDSGARTPSDTGEARATPGQVTLPITAGRCPAGQASACAVDEGAVRGLQARRRDCPRGRRAQRAATGVDEEVIAATVSAVAPTSDRAAAVADHFSANQTPSHRGRRADRSWRCGC